MGVATSRAIDNAEYPLRILLLAPYALSKYQIKNTSGVAEVVAPFKPVSDPVVATRFLPRHNNNLAIPEVFLKKGEHMELCNTKTCDFCKEMRNKSPVTQKRIANQRLQKIIESYTVKPIPLTKSDEDREYQNYIDNRLSEGGI